MKRDYSGKSLSPQQNKVLLGINIVLFLIAVAALGVAIYHEEVVIAVAMLLVMIVSAGNAIMSWLRLKGKKI